MSGGTILYSGEAWESAATWPTVNKVFNVAAFREPERRFSTEAQAPNQRAQGYPLLPQNYLSRGQPQLTYFEGTYEVPAHEGNAASFCKYPRLVGPSVGGRRECLQPGALTAAELEAKRKEQLAVENAMAAAIRKSNETHQCDVNYAVYENGKIVPGKTQKATQYVRSTNAQGVQEIYSCPAPGKFIRHQAPVVVKGLGVSAAEEVAMATQSNAYRTTELALLGLFAAGLFLVWRG